MDLYWAFMDSLAHINPMPPTPPNERVFPTPPPELATMSNETPSLTTTPSSHPLPSALRKRQRPPNAPALAFQLPGQPPPQRSLKRKLSAEPDDVPKPKRETHRTNERRFKMPLKTMFAEAKGHKDKVMRNRLGSRLRWGSYDGFTAAQGSGRGVISDMEYRRGKIEGVLDEFEDEWDTDMVDGALGDIVMSEWEPVAPAADNHNDRGQVLAECRVVFVDYIASIQNYEDTHEARVMRLRRSNKLKSASLEVPQRLLPHNIVAEWTASILPDLLVPTPQPDEAKTDESDAKVSVSLSPGVDTDLQRPTTPPPSPRPKLQPATPPPAADEFRTMGLNASPGQRSIHFRRAEVDQHAARLRGLLGSLTDTERFDHLDRKTARDTQIREQRVARMFANCVVKPEPGTERIPLSELKPFALPSAKTSVSKGAGLLDRSGGWSFLKTSEERRSSNTGGDSRTTTRPKRMRSDGLPLVVQEDLDDEEEDPDAQDSPSTEMNEIQGSGSGLESATEACVVEAAMLDDTEDNATSTSPVLVPPSQDGGAGQGSTVKPITTQDGTSSTEDREPPAGSTVTTALAPPLRLDTNTIIDAHPAPVMPTEIQ